MALAVLLGTLMAVVAGCSYVYEEANGAASASATPEKIDYTMTVQELLAPKGAVYGFALSKPLPASGPCSYVEAVVSQVHVDHMFPTRMFTGVQRGLAMVRSDMGTVLVYRTYVFEQLRWETPEARNTSAQVIKITDDSFESLRQRDDSLRALLKQIESSGMDMQPPYYLVDKACLSGSGGSIQYS